MGSCWTQLKLEHGGHRGRGRETTPLGILYACVLELYVNNCMIKKAMRFVCVFLFEEPLGDLS